MIDIMNTPDSPLHKSLNCINSIPRNAVGEATRRVDCIIKDVADKHVIVEPENSRSNVTKEVFDKMTLVESVIAKRDESVYLGNKRLQLTSELQQVKNEVKEATRSKTNDEIVNDMIK